jgi:hypothetical protein
MSRSGFTTYHVSYLAGGVEDIFHSMRLNLPEAEMAEYVCIRHKARDHFTLTVPQHVQQEVLHLLQTHPQFVLL